LDVNLKKYIKEYGHLVKHLSFYRKKEELDKIFISENASLGIDLLLELELDKYLDLKNLKKVVVTTSSLGIWAQLDVLSIYPFTNNEKKIISNIKRLLNEDIRNPFILYHNDLYVCSLVGEINKINKKEITERYVNLPIHSRKDIALTSEEICKLLNKKTVIFLKNIFNDLEFQILKNELVNDKNTLEEYILKKYSIKDYLL